MIITAEIVKTCFRGNLQSLDKTKLSFVSIFHRLAVYLETNSLLKVKCILGIAKTGNSNDRLKSAVDMPLCVLKRGDLCDRMSSRENEARFLHQNEVNLRDRE